MKYTHVMALPFYRNRDFGKEYQPDRIIKDIYDECVELGQEKDSLIVAAVDGVKRGDDNIPGNEKINEILLKTQKEYDIPHVVIATNQNRGKTGALTGVFSYLLGDDVPDIHTLEESRKVYRPDLDDVMLYSMDGDGQQSPAFVFNLYPGMKINAQVGKTERRHPIKMPPQRIEAEDVASLVLLRSLERTIGGKRIESIELLNYREGIGLSRFTRDFQAGGTAMKGKHISDLCHSIKDLQLTGLSYELVQTLFSVGQNLEIYWLTRPDYGKPEPLPEGFNWVKEWVPQYTEKYGAIMKYLNLRPEDIEPLVELSLNTASAKEDVKKLMRESVAELKEEYKNRLKLVSNKDDILADKK